MRCTCEVPRAADARSRTGDRRRPVCAAGIALRRGVLSAAGIARRRANAPITSARESGRARRGEGRKGPAPITRYNSLQRPLSPKQCASARCKVSNNHLCKVLDNNLCPTTTQNILFSFCEDYPSMLSSRAEPLLPISRTDSSGRDGRAGSKTGAPCRGRSACPSHRRRRAAADGSGRWVRQ